MPSKQDANKMYAEMQIQLSLEILESDPDNEKIKDKLAYWSATLGDFKTADKYAVTEKTKSIIDDLR